MSTPKFVDVHNLVAFLSKPTEFEGFEQIIDFLNANPIKYSLTIHIKVDGKKVIISEATIRRDLKFEDERGIDFLSNEVIFEQLTLMGYENLSQKLTFNKALFSLQWKFLIHTILQCLSAKTSTWNEFSTTMASAIICLATNKKFNFSKYIFESMVKRLEKKRRSRTNGLKRLYKVGLSARVESSTEEQSLGEEDASKQGRNIADIDADAEITLVDETAEDQGSTAAPITTADVTPNELTMAQALVEIKKSKHKGDKVVIKQEPDQGATTTTVTIPTPDSTRPKARGVVMQEPSETPTTTTTIPTSSKVQDKLKNKSFDEVQKAFDKTISGINSFVPMDSVVVRLTDSEVVKDKIVLKQESSSKRAGDELDQERSKKQKVEDDKESEELKRCLEIISDDGDDVTIDDTPLSIKTLIIDYKI
uniref:Ribonuclease H-like domain, reverse transcriptase, RNA-dependent DNA polymerase n=1 Tax=Tanacetum cinerariifolium TaxID=118510 RepID=A0A6L2NIN3_TANCI|nr:ribonuclease H-like domain, reverse transcriptase, RNA-dependent DNA polymerase [Tanacetum cinerariifolium]